MRLPFLLSCPVFLLYGFLRKCLKKIASSHLVAVIYVYYELHKNINMLIEATTFVYDNVLIGLKPPPMTIVNYSRVHYS